MISLKTYCAVSLAVLILEGCGNLTRIGRPEEGYKALFFKQAVDIEVASLATYTIEPNTTLIGDNNLNGHLVFCGNMRRDGSLGIIPVVITADSDVIPSSAEV